MPETIASRIDPASNPANMRTFFIGEVLPFILGLFVAVALLVFSENPLKGVYAAVAGASGLALWIILLIYRLINYLKYVLWYVHDTTTPLMDTLVSALGGRKKVLKG